MYNVLVQVVLNLKSDKKHFRPPKMLDKSFVPAHVQDFIARNSLIVSWMPYSQADIMSSNLFKGSLSGLCHGMVLDWLFHPHHIYVQALPKVFDELTAAFWLRIAIMQTHVNLSSLRHAGITGIALNLNSDCILELIKDHIIKSGALYINYRVRKDLLTYSNHAIGVKCGFDGVSSNIELFDPNFGALRISFDQATHATAIKAIGMILVNHCGQHANAIELKTRIDFSNVTRIDSRFPFVFKRHYGFHGDMYMHTNSFRKFHQIIRHELLIELPFRRRKMSDRQLELVAGFMEHFCNISEPDSLDIFELEALMVFLYGVARRDRRWLELEVSVRGFITTLKTVLHLNPTIYQYFISACAVTKRFEDDETAKAFLHSLPKPSFALFNAYVVGEMKVVSLMNGLFEDLSRSQLIGPIIDHMVATVPNVELEQRFLTSFANLGPVVLANLVIEPRNFYDLVLRNISSLPEDVVRKLLSCPAMLSDQVSLVSAARLNELWLIKELVARGIHPLTVVDARGRSILEIATDDGNSEIVRYCLDNMPDDFLLGESKKLYAALTIALTKRHNSIALSLLHRAGTNRADYADKNGNTILHCSVINGDQKLLNKCLAISTIDTVNHKNFEGKTPLHIAVLADNFPMLARLLGSGGCGSIDIFDAAGETPLSYAFSAHRKRFREKMFNYSSSKTIEAVDKDGVTMLMKAMKLGYYDALRDVMIRSGVPYLQMIDSNGNSVLHYFKASVDHRFFEIMLRRGAHVHLGTENHAGVVPLFEVIKSKVTSLIKCCEEYFNGELLTKVNKEGVTALMSAVAIDSEGLVKSLLGKGALPTINNVNIRGESALSLAINNDNIRIITTLIKAGADPFKDSGRGICPFEKMSSVQREFVSRRCSLTVPARFAELLARDCYDDGDEVGREDEAAADLIASQNISKRLRVGAVVEEMSHPAR